MSWKDGTARYLSIVTNAFGAVNALIAFALDMDVRAECFLNSGPSLLWMFELVSMMGQREG